MRIETRPSKDGSRNGHFSDTHCKYLMTSDAYNCRNVFIFINTHFNWMCFSPKREASKLYTVGQPCLARVLCNLHGGAVADLIYLFVRDQIWLFSEPQPPTLQDAWLLCFCFANPMMLLFNCAFNDYDAAIFLTGESARAKPRFWLMPLMSEVTIHSSLVQLT